ncbi:hypothetical protein ACQP1W_01995 [Spirillospora sp. CA-255316]
MPAIGVAGAIPLGTAVAALVWTLAWWLPNRAPKGGRAPGERVATLTGAVVTAAVAATSLAATAAHSSAGGAAAGSAAFVETVALLALVVLTLRYALPRPAVVAAITALVAVGASLLRLFVPSSTLEAVSMCVFAALPTVAAIALGGYLRALDARDGPVRCVRRGGRSGSRSPATCTTSSPTT